MTSDELLARAVAWAALDEIEGKRPGSDFIRDLAAMVRELERERDVEKAGRLRLYDLYHAANARALETERERDEARALLARVLTTYSASPADRQPPGSLFADIYAFLARDEAPRHPLTDYVRAVEDAEAGCARDEAPRCTCTWDVKVHGHMVGCPPADACMASGGRDEGPPCARCGGTWARVDALSALLSEARAELAALREEHENALDMLERERDGWQHDPRTKQMDVEIQGAMEDKARAEAALADLRRRTIDQNLVFTHELERARALLARVERDGYYFSDKLMDDVRAFLDSRRDEARRPCPEHDLPAVCTCYPERDEARGAPTFEVCIACSVWADGRPHAPGCSAPSDGKTGLTADDACSKRPFSGPTTDND